MDFQPTRLPVYTRQTLIAEIKRVATTHFAGLCPTHREFNQFSRVHSATVAKEFGSWADAMRAAGFECLRSRARPTEIGADLPKITPELLMKELKSVARKHVGTVFQYGDYRRLGGRRARGTFCKYLGGWRQAVAAIGLRDGFSRPRPDLRTYADEDYFVEMQRLWETLGRQPMAREMRKYGKISPQSFQQRFGSWMRSVHDFCQDRSRPEGGDLIDGRKRWSAAQADDPRPAEAQAPAVNRQASAAGPNRRTPRKPSVRLRFRVLQRDHFTCRACGRSPARELGVNLEADHILAWSRGGETTFDNLQTLCERCNSGKSNA
jgi:5-methylcytosine-specific restriction endonuclease McrA